MNDRPGDPAGRQRDDGSPVFREPWEAQAAGDADQGDTYYHHWLAALEALVTARGASSPEELSSYRRAWAHAADRTPHGQPIDLERTDFGVT